MATSFLERAFAIVELLATEARGLALAAIADRLELPKSAAHRLLAQLVDLGYVRQDAESSRYFPSTKLASLGFHYLASSGVADLAQPILDELARKTGELVRLSVFDAGAQVWVAKAQVARAGLRYDPDMGAEVPLFCTAAGHSWLACLPDEEAIALVKKQGFGRVKELGARAPRTLEAVLERVRLARRRGYATVVESWAPGTAAMAAAVRHATTGRVLGTVSVAGPSVRLTEARMSALAADLLDAAAQLSAASLGSAALVEASRSAGGASRGRRLRRGLRFR